MRAGNLISMLHAETGIDTTELALKARRLREANLFVRETRSPNSPRASARHVANLLMMILSDAPALYAERTVERASAMTCDDLKHARANLDAGADFELFKRDETSFIDALEFLIEKAAENPGWFQNAYRNTFIEFEPLSFVATIYLHVLEPGPLGGRSVFDATLTYADHSNAITSSAPSAFRRTTRLEAPLLCAIGAEFARQDG